MDADLNDTELVRAAMAGDKAAYGVLIVRHRPMVLAVCRRALRDADLAEDVTQDAILHAMLSLDHLRRPDRFGAWLAGIGLNLCYRHHRWRSREAWAWETLPGGQVLPEAVDPGPTVEDELEAVELRRWIGDAVAILPAGQRAAVTLHYLAGLSHIETAALLGIAPGAVKTRLHKARANLRRSLRQEINAKPTGEEGHTMVPMKIADVGRHTSAEDGKPRYFVALEAEDGHRRLPIWIGAPEATALALHLEAIPFPRPMTYGLMAGLVTAAGGKLHEVRIDRLDGEVFYAVAVLDGPAGRAEVDARPSDALNLALALSAPVLVAEGVLATAGHVRGEEPGWLGGGQVEGRATIVAELESAWPSRQRD